MPEETLVPASTEVSYVSEVNDRWPELSPEPIDKRPIIYGTVVALGFLVLFVGLGVWLFYHPVATAVLRDIFVIFLGLGAFIIILLLIALIVITSYLVLKTNDLVRLLDREIKPMLRQTQSTLNQVQGTTKFLSEQAVEPVFKTVSTVAATRAIFRSLFRRS
jgi:hypothetical protein